MEKLKILISIVLMIVLVSNVTYSTFAVTGEWGQITDKNGNGDVNGDYKVNEADLEMIKSHITGVETLSAAQIKRADADKNGRIDIRDYNKIFSKIQGN